MSAVTRQCRIMQVDSVPKMPAFPPYSTDSMPEIAQHKVAVLRHQWSYGKNCYWRGHEVLQTCHEVCQTFRYLHCIGRVVSPM